jgi:uncharacterized membrane protein HdeD (DUF308 family)
VFRYSSLPELEDISRNWGWFLILGVALMALGFFALLSSLLTTVVSVKVFGRLLIAGGILETFVAFGPRHSRGLLVRVLTGVVSIAVGTVLARYPLASVGGLTILLTWLFLTTGLMRTITSVILRYPAWEWTLLESIGSIIVALLIWISWPVSSLWVIGDFAGMGLIFRGLGWLKFALGARHVRKVVFA